MSKKLKKQKFQPQAIIGFLEGALRDLSNFRDPWDDTLDTQSILTTGYRDAKLQRDVVRRMRFIDDLYSDAVICAFSHVGHGHGRQAAGPTIPTRQRRIWASGVSWEHRHPFFLQVFESIRLLRTPSAWLAMSGGQGSHELGELGQFGSKKWIRFGSATDLCST